MSSSTGRRLDEQHVRARVGVDPRPGDRGVEALDGGGVGARDEHEVGVAPGGDGGADLAGHLVGADQGLAAHVPALLRHHLVLQVDAGHPGLLVLPHRAHYVDRVAVPGVGVGDHRHVDGRDDPAGVVDISAPRQQTDVRAARSARPWTRTPTCRRRRTPPAPRAGRTGRRTTRGRRPGRGRPAARAAGPRGAVRSGSRSPTLLVLSSAVGASQSCPGSGAARRSGPSTMPSAPTDSPASSRGVSARGA